MANNVEVEVAIGILRQSQFQIGKRHKRYHEETMSDNAIRLRALDGICGQCPNLEINILNLPGGRKGVSLHCQGGQSPVRLYRHTPQGIVPSCPEFVETALGLRYK